MVRRAEAELVSVVIPAYNAAATLRRSIDSALRQTHRDVEVVVVDDGSTDGTPGICRSAAAESGRVRWIRQANSGVAAARNAGIAAGSGRLIAPLDADDVWHPEKIERQVRALREGPRDVGLVYCLARRVDAEDRLVEDGACACACACPTGWVYPALVNSNAIRSASIPLMRRDLVEAAGGYDVSLHRRGAQGCEDFKLYLLLAERARFACVPEYLVGYRTGVGNMSARTLQNLRSWHLVVEEARARHALPGWLHRWAAGNFHRWASFTALDAGEVRLGLRLLLRALTEDPGGSLRSEVLEGYARAFAARAGEAAGIRRGPDRGSRGVPPISPRQTGRRRPRPAFDELDPAVPPPLDCPAWEARRMERALALALPPAPGLASRRERACP